MLWGEGQESSTLHRGLDNVRIQLCEKSEAGCSRQGHCGVVLGRSELGMIEW